MHALEERDWIFPSYRESAVGLLSGIPPRPCSPGGAGIPPGGGIPADHGVASICVPIATQVPHAAGFAWGSMLRGEDRVALVFFGDGATSEGAFHEGANLAAVKKAPLVLLCNNNQWAISTPVTEQTAAVALVDKAAGYGIPGVRVDGTDVLAVHAAVRRAAARARSGDGPTFLEAVTYRAAPHATADDPSAYIDPARVEEARRERLPRRASRRTCAGAVCSPTSSRETVRDDALELMRAGIAAAEAEPPAGSGASLRARVRRPAGILRARSRRAAEGRPWLSVSSSKR